MMTTARDVVDRDLDYICDALTDELATLGGEKLLITGGAGFLGYYMVQAIVHWNRLHDPSRRIGLTVMDNFMRGVPQWLTELEGLPGLTLLRRSILEPLPDDFPDFQAVVHAAGIASPIYYRRYPIETMDANVDGLRQILDGCVDRIRKGNPLRAMLYFSTSEIYGDPTPENIPTPETYRGNVSCTGPRACYDESKRFGETLCVSFSQVHGIPVKVARPFNNYGPGLKISDGRVIPDFARDILAGRDIVMKSDGSPTRTFCYAADAVVGYYKVLLRGRNGEAYNIGVESPEISMRELADRLVGIAGDLFGYTGRVVCQAEAHQDYLVDNPNRRCPVITKARTELGYDPRIGIDDGLVRSMVWYGGNREAEDK
ncbi:MAG TPA: NAD-dependent epimerase/dehydratase family protein [Longimicrobiales bacterium]|nr:NAD-dependent epimerase/dehydratase family protein [Longimicrobiales bacterium]